MNFDIARVAQVIQKYVPFKIRGRLENHSTPLESSYSSNQLQILLLQLGVFVFLR